MDTQNLNTYSKLEILKYMQGEDSDCCLGLYGKQDFEYINMENLQNIAKSMDVKGKFSASKEVNNFKEKYDLDISEDELLLEYLVPLDDLYGKKVNLISSEVPKDIYNKVEVELNEIDYIDLECTSIRVYDYLDIITLSDGLDGFDISGLLDDSKTTKLCDMLLEYIDDIELRALLDTYGAIHLIVGVVGQELDVLGSIYTKVDSIDELEDIVDSIGLQSVVKSIDTIDNIEFLEVLDEKLEDEAIRFVSWCLPEFDLKGILQRENTNLEYIIGEYVKAELVFTKRGYGIQVNFNIDGIVKSVIMTLADFFALDLQKGKPYSLGFSENKIYKII